MKGTVSLSYGVGVKREWNLNYYCWCYFICIDNMVNYLSFTNTHYIEEKKRKNKDQIYREYLFSVSG